MQVSSNFWTNKKVFEVLHKLHQSTCTTIYTLLAGLDNLINGQIKSDDTEGNPILVSETSCKNEMMDFICSYIQRICFFFKAFLWNNWEA